MSATTRRGGVSRYDRTKHKWLLDAPFAISHKCCFIMKKDPSASFERKTKMRPILGTMAEDSSLRETSWVRTGCNAFESTRPKSMPLSFWTKQDILHYVYRYKLDVCSLYGEVSCNGGVYCNSGVSGTGCVFCIFGAHLEKHPNRFERMKVEHPQLYDYCMRPWEEGGLGLRKVLDYIGVSY